METEMSDSKEEPVELVLQDYKFNPKPVNLKMRWKKKTQLWLQTDTGIVRIYRGWLGRFWNIISLGLKNRIKDR
jgi:hypothetical protein